MKVNRPGRPRAEAGTKQKYTFYMTDSVRKKFNELYAFGVVRGLKDTRSDVLCKSVLLLYEKMFEELKGA